MFLCDLKAKNFFTFLMDYFKIKEEKRKNTESQNRGRKRQKPSVDHESSNTH